MSSTWGSRVKISVFGESHSAGIGVVIDGFPAGVAIDLDEVQRFMARRAPGEKSYSTKRCEKDTPKIMSGIVEGVTCGTPICCVIENTDTRSQDYGNLFDIPRPGHADYTGYVKYGGNADVRGGGHFSGRLTAPICFAGALCIQYLQSRGIEIGAHLYSVRGVKDTPFDMAGVSAGDLQALRGKKFPTISDSRGEEMLAAIECARLEGDSAGGVVECAAVNLPAGLGEPMFNAIECDMASLLFGLPAVKGVEFGAGFAASEMLGSENNDPFFMSGDRVATATNNHGGILGGITSGMPIIVRAAFKPTSSIYKEQESVSLKEGKNTKLQIRGRHDPCVAVRAVPCVEATVALCIMQYI